MLATVFFASSRDVPFAVVDVVLVVVDGSGAFAGVEVAGTRSMSLSTALSPDMIAWATQEMKMRR